MNGRKHYGEAPNQSELLHHRAPRERAIWLTWLLQQAGSLQPVEREQNQILAKRRLQLFVHDPGYIADSRAPVTMTPHERRARVQAMGLVRVQIVNEGFSLEFFDDKPFSSCVRNMHATPPDAN